MKPIVLVVIATLFVAHPLPGDEVLFNRDILPILSDHCFQCHGPDAASREADLRLDSEADAKQSGDDEPTIIVPGAPEKSGLVLRITTDDADLVMPPTDSGKQLTDDQKRLLTRWIKEGAVWEEHWAYQAIPQPERTFAKPRQAIDHFINKRLGDQQITPNPPAEPSIWLRRVSFDLTGLPPTVSEIESFKTDLDFEGVVTRLLASDRYGERMAWEWLEAARYADTHGYQKDNVRTMWAWRDWVIDAFNNNMPFDQFTIEQLAGDLLPDATIDQQIATGFNRNHRINAEAGSIDEEFRTEYVIDRTDTMATVWMGMTAGCARCHDHKFDPLSQRQYYQLFAFFNNIEEKGSDGVATTALPDLPVPVPGKEHALARAQRALQDAEKGLRSQADHHSGAFERWVISQQQIQRSSNFWLLSTPKLVSGTNPDSTFTTLKDDSILFGGANPLNDLHEIQLEINTPLEITGLRLEAFPDESLTDRSLARSFDGDFLLSELRLLVNGDLISLIGATAETESSEHFAALAIDSDPLTGWSVGPQICQPVAAIFEFAETKRLASGDKLTVQLRYESREEQYMIGRFRISLGVGDSSHVEFSAKTLAAINEGDRESLLDIYRETAPGLVGLRSVRDAAQRTVDQLIASSETRVMVMRERPGKSRVTHLLGRGLYDQPGEVVTAGVPSFLGVDVPEGPAAPNRLTLARWLVDPNHPLTSRVAVNRIWQQVFGTGLVKTSEDFGHQGERPSHPELLDWLAADFIGSGWNVKRLFREIVLSDSYRRSAVVGPDLLDHDPDNRLFARAPRYRLSAPMIRDQALFLSGLMTHQLGGPPVKPWQPDGLWQAVAGVNSNTTHYQSDRGANLFRRSLYTFWKRGMPPPNMVLFDAANREICSVGRSTTNSPLQALTSLNDPSFSVSAIALAGRVIAETDNDEDQILGQLWLRTQGNSPDENQLSILVETSHHHRSLYAANPDRAAQRVAPAAEWLGEIKDIVTLATFSEVAEVLFNLDSTLTIH